MVAIPTQVFYDDVEAGRHLIRFAFCKRPRSSPRPSTASSPLAALIKGKLYASPPESRLLFP